MTQLIVLIFVIFDHGHLPHGVFLFNVLVVMRCARWHPRTCIVQCVEPEADLSSCTGPVFASRSSWWVCVSSHGVRLCLDCKGEDTCHWKKMALAVYMYVRSSPKICQLSERGEHHRRNTWKKSRCKPLGSSYTRISRPCTLHLADDSHYMSLINSAY